jgi:hypothetical protein
VAVCLHGLALAVIDIGSILAGFAVYRVLHADDQLLVQVPVALASAVVAFAAWLAGVRRALPEALQLGWPWAALGAWGAALALGPALLVPLHYATQGYLSSMGNIVGLWLFQVPANAAALVVARRAALSGGAGTLTGPA